jgi:hypothetical protein
MAGPEKKTSLEDGVRDYKKEAAAVLKKHKDSLSNLVVLQNELADSPETAKEIIELIGQKDMVAALAVYLENKIKSPKVTKKELEELKKDFEITVSRMEEIRAEMDTVKQEKAKPAKREKAKPVKKEKAPGKKSTKPKKETEVKPENTEKKPEKKEETEKEPTDHERRIGKLVGYMGMTEDELRKKPEAEIQDLFNQLIEDRRHEGRLLAQLFFIKKIPTAEINELKRDAARARAIAMGWDGSTDTLEQFVAEASREANRYVNETDAEIERVLTPKTIEQAKEVLTNKDLEIMVHNNPDLDARMFVYILKALGKLENNVATIKKGGDAAEGILGDVGNSRRILAIRKNRIEMNHHFEGIGVKTSSAEIALKTLDRLGIIEKVEPWMHEMVKFVTEVDNMSYPRKDLEWFRTSYPKTLLGLRDILSTEALAAFFKAKKNPYEELTAEELKQVCEDRNGDKQRIEILARHVEKRTKESIYGAQYHERQNLIKGRKTYSPKLGKVLFYEPEYGAVTKDGNPKETHNIPLGSHAAYLMGYDSYVRIDLAERYFFVSRPGEDLTEAVRPILQKDKNAIIVRGSMILRSKETEKDPSVPVLNYGQLLNYTGLSAPRGEYLEVSTEFTTQSDLRFELRHTDGSRVKILNNLEKKFKTYIEYAKKNKTEFEKELEVVKNETRSWLIRRETRLKNKIDAMEQEEALWKEKLNQITKLKSNPKLPLQMLVDETKLLKRTELEDKNAAKEIAVAGEAAEEKKRETSEDTTERKDERVERIAELKKRYDEIAQILAEESLEKGEFRKLMAEYYNIAALGRYLENGSKGPEPKPLTYTEVLQKVYGEPGTPIKESREKPEKEPAPEKKFASKKTEREKEVGGATPEEAQNIDRELLDGIVSIFNPKDRLVFEQEAKKVKTERQYDQFIKKISHEIRTRLNALFEKRNLKIAEYVPEYFPHDIEAGIDYGISPSSVPIINASAYFILNGTRYFLHTFDTMPEKERKDPKMVMYYDILKRTQKDVDRKFNDDFLSKINEL